jgi:hypothetical protein
MALSIPFTPSPQVVLRRKERTRRVNRLLRFRFSDLWCARHGGSSFITDTREGRLMLKLLLRVRTTAESTMQSAPWLTERELKALRKAGRKVPWDKIGELLKLTDRERTAHKLWYFRPIDVPWEEVRRRQSLRNNEKDCERKRKARAKNKELRDMVSNSHDRKDVILTILADANLLPRPRGVLPRRSRPPSGSGWTAVPVLVQWAKTSAAFRRPDGWSLRNLRDAVHCTLERLEADGEIEKVLCPGARGLVGFVRIRAPHTDGICYGNSVTGVLHTDAFSDRRSVGGIAEAETVDSPKASTEKRASENLSGLVIGRADARRYAPEAPQRAPAAALRQERESPKRGSKSRPSEVEPDAPPFDQPPPSERRH